MYAAPLLLLLVSIFGGQRVCAVELKDWGLYGRTNSAVGYEHTQDLLKQQNTYAQWSLRQQHEWGLSDDASGTKLRFQYQILVDTARREGLDGPDQDNLQKLVLYVEKPWGPWRVSVGQQEVSWGENLLMPILDIVNPHDLSHPRGYYDPASKQPVPMVNIDYQRQAWNAQLIAIPQAIRSRQPEKIQNFGIDDRRRYRLGLDGEYGGRVGLLSGGIDTKVYYFSYWPRVPSYIFTPFSASKDVEIIEKRVDTTGLSVSYAEMNWLFRGDFAHHLNYPSTQIGTEIERSTLDQTILGWSWTSDTQQTLGTELHLERWERVPTAYVPGPWVDRRRKQRFYSWIGLNGSLRLLRGKVEPQFLTLRGLNTEDRLMRILIPWNYNEALTITTELQSSKALSSSPKILLSLQKTLSLRLVYNW